MSTAPKKLALITGGTKGIGAATALHLSSLGHLVAISYSSDESAATSLVSQLGGPSRALAIKGDAGSVADITRLVGEAVKWGAENGVVGEDGKTGKIDVLIPNAADGAAGVGLEQTTEEGFERCMGLNIRGPYFLVQKAAPNMTTGGRIILLSTSLCNSSTITPNYLLYTTTKGAIEQMTRVLAKDLGRRQITVNCLAPGPTATDLFFKGKSDELVKMIAGTNPFQRLGTPEEIANAIGFLAGDASSWVNGQILRVNGGMTVG